MPHTVFFSQKPKAATVRTNSSRQRPLHACGVSILSIANIAFAKTQEINGPLGSYLRMMAKLGKFATPLINALQYQWLAILSFLDDHILAAERITEKVFPPSKHAFNKIDELVLIISSMSEKFDGAVNKLPTLIHKVPLMEWVMTHVIKRLNSLFSVLDHWELEDYYSRTKEKTIGVDRNFNENMEQSSSKCIPVDSLESFPPISETAQKEFHEKIGSVVSSSHMKGSYKEALLETNPHDDGSGDELCEVNERVLEKDDRISNDDNEEGVVVKGQVERSGSIKRGGGGGGDVILKLFDSWLMNPGRF